MKYGLSLQTPPAEEPLTLPEAKSHLRVDFADEDTGITGLIASARKRFEDETGRQLITAQYRMRFDRLPTGEGIILLPKAPLQSVETLSYIDVDGNSQALTENTDFVVETDREPGRIRLAYNKTWPSCRRQPNAATIDFTAGYGAAAAVDELIKDALRLMIGQNYEFREELISGTIIAQIPRGAASIMTLYDIGDELLEYGWSEED